MVRVLRYSHRQPRQALISDNRANGVAIKKTGAARPGSIKSIDFKTEGRGY